MFSQFTFLALGRVLANLIFIEFAYVQIFLADLYLIARFFIETPASLEVPVTLILFCVQLQASIVSELTDGSFLLVGKIIIARDDGEVAHEMRNRVPVICPAFN